MTPHNALWHAGGATRINKQLVLGTARMRQGRAITGSRQVFIMQCILQSRMAIIDLDPLSDLR